jgi:hypothetical protein
VRPGGRYSHRHRLLTTLGRPVSSDTQLAPGHEPGERSTTRSTTSRVVVRSGPTRRAFPAPRGSPPRPQRWRPERLNSAPTPMALLSLCGSSRLADTRVEPTFTHRFGYTEDSNAKPAYPWPPTLPSLRPGRTVAHGKCLITVCESAGGPKLSLAQNASTSPRVIRQQLARHVAGDPGCSELPPERPSASEHPVSRWREHCPQLHQGACHAAGSQR